MSIGTELSQISLLTLDPLSEREVEVLLWVAAGASNREIGQRLYIAESTVKRHVYNIFGKLNVRNRTQAALQAHNLGLDLQSLFRAGLQGV